MKICFIIFAFTVINVSCYTQWVQQVSGTARDFLGLDMLDANTGYVCGDQVGSILKTTNSGVNWILYDEPTNDQYNGISFINAFTGLAVGPPGLVLRTSNGGINWSIISRPGGDKGPVQFVTLTTAYSAGDDIVKSIDGGLSWSIILLGTLSQYQGLYFIDENTGTVVGRPGLIRTTTNGGASWIQRTMHLPVQFGDSTLFDVMYVNSLTGYACGNNGIVMKTTNGGVNWAYKPTGTLNSLKGVYFTDANTGTVVGFPVIWRTTNGGDNWINQSLLSPLNVPLWGVDFVNQQTGWVIGFNGLIVKTINGGFTWIQPISSEISQNFKLDQNYPNPFNPTTKIKFDIPLSRGVSEGQGVLLTIYDVLGREVAILVNEQLQPGTYEVEWNAANYSSGIYFYKITSGDFIETKKMILLK